MSTAQLPIQAQILLTERCNLRCKHCAVPEEWSPVAKASELSTDEWRSIIARLVRHGVSRLWFTGGEPLLRQDLPELVTHGLRLGVERVVVVTNATTLRPAVAECVASLCRGYPRFSLHVSLDGASAHTHDRMRGEGSWTRSLAGIDRLRSLGGRVDVVQTVLTRSSAEELCAFPDLLRRVGSRGWHVFSLAAVGRAEEWPTERVEPNVWPQVFEVLTNLEHQGYKVGVMGPIVDEDWPEESALQPRASLDRTPTVIVGPDAELFTCPFLRHVRIGSGRSDVSVADAVERLAAVMDMACPTCRYLTVCAGLNRSMPLVAGQTPRTHPHDIFPKLQLVGSLA